MKSIGMLLLGTAIGAAYGYIAGNPMTRKAAMGQMKKFPGMVIDQLNRRGGGDVQATSEEPILPDEPTE